MPNRTWHASLKRAQISGVQVVNRGHAYRACIQGMSGGALLPSGSLQFLVLVEDRQCGQRSAQRDGNGHGDGHNFDAAHSYLDWLHMPMGTIRGYMGTIRTVSGGRPNERDDVLCAVPEREGIGCVGGTLRDTKLWPPWWRRGPRRENLHAFMRCQCGIWVHRTVGNL